MSGSGEYARFWNRPGESPAQQLGRMLAEYRRAGRTFFQAWPLAMARIKFTSQREQISWLRVWDDVHVFSGWMAGYERRPHLGAMSVAALEGTFEHLALPDASSTELRSPPLAISSEPGVATMSSRPRAVR